MVLFPLPDVTYRRLYDVSTKETAKKGICIRKAQRQPSQSVTSPPMGPPKPIPSPLKTLATPCVKPLDRSEYISLITIVDVVKIPPPPTPDINLARIRVSILVDRPHASVPRAAKSTAS